MNIFINEHIELLKLLVNHHVRFMLIGGYAVIHYGYERTTGDMDIWLQLGNDNKNKLLEALEEFGIEENDIEQLRKMDFVNPLPVFFIGKKPRRIDFVTLISNISFELAIKKVKYFSIMENIKVPVIDFDHLILSKTNTGRSKDKADIEELQRINRTRNEDNTTKKDKSTM